VYSHKDGVKLLKINTNKLDLFTFIYGEEKLWREGNC